MTSHKLDTKMTIQANDFDYFLPLVVLILSGPKHLQTQQEQWFLHQEEEDPLVESLNDECPPQPFEARLVLLPFVDPGCNITLTLVIVAWRNAPNE